MHHAVMIWNLQLYSIKTIFLSATCTRKRHSPETFPNEDRLQKPIAYDFWVPGKLHVGREIKAVAGMQRSGVRDVRISDALSHSTCFRFQLRYWVNLSLAAYSTLLLAAPCISSYFVSSKPAFIPEKLCRKPQRTLGQCCNLKHERFEQLTRNNGRQLSNIIPVGGDPINNYRSMIDGNGQPIKIICILRDIDR